MIRPLGTTTQFSARTLFCVAGALCFVLTALDTAGQEPTPQEKQIVRRIKSNIDRAGKHFNDKKMDQSRRSIEAAMQQVSALVIAARPELIDLIKPEYERLQRAHQLLTKAGQTLDKLAPLPEPLDEDSPTISFRSAVAPILVQRCGNCHVSRNRGDFSAATFESLANSTMIAQGFPTDSRLIEVIESGEMPKGGMKVEPAELDVLKAWIKQGARFDGNDPRRIIDQFVESTTPNRGRPTEPATPTGKETVSFGNQVAPILLEHCGQCHINSNNPRGNLNLATFRGLMSGGDSGPAIKAGSAKESFLFTQIDSGEMPPDRKLESKSIQLIGTWIDEGAKFDGGDPRLDIQTVVAKARADAQSHEELAEARRQLAEKTWTLVMNDIDSLALSSENFLVVGSPNESRLTDVSKLIEGMVPKIANALGANPSRPLIKGNASVFVFDKRYDFSEFGNMVEQREFPQQLAGHWGFNTVDAYIAVLMTRNRTVDDRKVLLARQIAALHVASLSPDVPDWFANGMGFWAARKIYPREDEVKTWEKEAKSAAKAMRKADDFMNARLPSEQGALVSYLFVKNLKSDASRFNRLMSFIREGGTFERSFLKAFGAPPSQLAGSIQSNGR